MSTENLNLLTKEQLAQIATHFDLKPNPEKTLPVRDGIVTKDTMVWWRGATGPQRTKAGDSTHWDNIARYPRAYQLKKPAIKVQYLD